MYFLYRIMGIFGHTYGTVKAQGGGYTVATCGSVARFDNIEDVHAYIEARIGKHVLKSAMNDN